MENLIEKDKKSSDYTISQLGIGAGAILQATSEISNLFNSKQLSNSEIVAMTVSNVPAADIIQLSETMKSQGDSYVGAIIVLVMAAGYVIKRSVLQYFELKGQIAIEIAKVQAQVQAIKQNTTKEVEQIKEE